MRSVAPGKVFAYVWRYWVRCPVKFSLIATGALVAVLVELQIPAMSADLVVAVKNVVDDVSTIDAAWTALGWLVGTFVLLALIQQFYLRIWMYLASQVMHRIISDAFARLQRFSADWHANNFAGSSVRRITRGMWAYDDFADIVVIDLGPGALMLIGFSVAMFLRDSTMGLYFAGAVIVYLAVTIILSLRYVAPANVESNEADTKVGGVLADAITCNSVVKAFGSEEREEGFVDETAFAWRKKARRAWTRSVNAGAVQSVLIISMMGGLFTIVLMSANTGDTKLDDIAYVITSYFIVNGYLRNIGWQIRGLQRAINELDDLVAIEEMTPQVENRPDAVTFRPGVGKITFDNVRFQYDNQPVPVFDGFGIDIEPGEKIALVGESGAGKTTFVKLVQRLYDIEAGQIVIDGQDVAAVTQESLRENIALVPQEPILFHRTLRENIAYGKPGASLDEIIDAAKKAHAHEFIERLREGYETLVGERGIKLSGGERQRVAIARAILADAPILILDEATSSLDSITEDLIQEAIGTLMRGRTSILIAHRLSTIRQADRILVFESGRIVEMGTHRELMRIDGGHYRRLYEMQSAGMIGGIEVNDEGDDTRIAS